MTGSADTETVRAMLGELCTFPALTKQDKLNLVNLPEITLSVSTSTPESATLCDICLVAPSIREWNSQDEVSRLCKVVYQYKRVV